MPEFRAAAAGLATFLAGLSVVGCSANEPASDLSDVSASLGAAVAGHPSEGPDAGGDSAQLIGTLEALDGCVMVRMDDGTVIMPSFPIGWTELDSSRALSWGGGSAVRLRDDVEIGGGFVPVSAVDLPDGCEADEAFVVTPLAP